MTEKSETKLARWICCLALASITFALFWPVRHFEFLCYDDPDYVTRNYSVQSGLTWRGVTWAFTTFHASNWHPFTWLSHMLDFQLWGNSPSGHHITNVLFHSANVVLVFLLLQRLTGAFWRSALVSAFFGWHPLHVESVAWISERKDVLSTFFWLVAMGAYARYVVESKSQRFAPDGKLRRDKPRSKIYYSLSLFFFALGLLSKPMVVTLPLVLLLIDFWPLQRIASFKLEKSNLVAWGRLVREKWPFFVLCIAAACVTLQAQNNTISSVDQSPIDLRVENALLSYAKYIFQMLWPSRLAVFYPHPDEIPIELAGLALVLVVVISFWTLSKAYDSPWLFIGWLWFLGTLVPVIGIIQAGQQAMADRYTYIPLLGLFIAVIWELAHWSVGRPNLKLSLNILAAFAITGCLIVTSRQLGYWRNDLTLFTHARDVTKRNFVACAVLASKKEVTDPDGAIADYDLALTFRPNSTEALYGKGRALLKAGRMEEAIASYRLALEIDPNYPEAHNGFGLILAQKGEFVEAEAEYRAALKINTDDLEARLNLALALFKDRKVNESITEFNSVLALEADSVDALDGLGNALTVTGQPSRAVTLFEHALRVKPGYRDAHRGMGMALVSEGKPDDAIPHFEEVLRQDPIDPIAHYQLGCILNQRGQTAIAIQHYEAVLGMEPNLVDALNNLAWIKATAADAQFRNGSEAVRLAQHACDLTHNSQPFLIGTLAAALAEADRFPEAVSMARKARDLASASGMKEIAARNDELIAMYQLHRAYHQDPGAKKRSGLTE
jgi:tetratricopeptide (TPR) repeat protein